MLNDVSVERHAALGHSIHEVQTSARRFCLETGQAVHAETSTGAWQPVPDIARLAHEVDALVVLDTVTSLGGCPVEVDAWGIDAAYSGTQECLSCPPGLSPLTFSE